MATVDVENALPNIPQEAPTTPSAKKDFTIVHEEDYQSADDSDFEVAEETVEEPEEETAAETEYISEAEELSEEEIEEEFSEEEEMDDKPQAEEMVGPISLTEEATLAYEFALSKGLSSTDDALEFVGRHNHQQKVIDNYLSLVDSSVTADYNSMSDEIFALRRGVNRGLGDLANALGVKVSSTALDFLSSVLKGYLSLSLGEAAKFSSLGEEHLVTEENLLMALKHLGRPVYTTSEPTMMEIASDEEYDSDFDSEAEEEVVLAEDPVETAFISLDNYEDLVTPLLIDLDVTLAEDVLSTLRDSTEDYLAQFLRFAMKSSEFAKKAEVGVAELKFTLDMWKSMPGQNIARSLHLS